MKIKFYTFFSFLLQTDPNLNLNDNVLSISKAIKVPIIGVSVNEFKVPLNICKGYSMIMSGDYSSF